MPSSDDIIKVSNICKTFKQGTNLFDNLVKSSPRAKTVIALKNISFSIKKGELVAILGRNGAGKTTLLKLLTSLLIPDRGDICINQYNTQKDYDAFKLHIGLMSGEERGFYWRLSIKGNLEFFAALYNMRKKEAKERIDYLCRYFDIKTPGKRFQECSTGIKQRCGLARSLLHNPAILFMDEPTRSLDPLSASQIRKYMQRLVKEEGKTVVFATHNTREAEKIADKIIILDKGRLTAMGDMNHLQSSYGNESFDLDELFSKIV